MTTVYVLVLAVGLIVAAMLIAKARRLKLEAELRTREKQVADAQAETQEIRRRAEAAVLEAQRLIDQQRYDILGEIDRARTHYEDETRKARLVSETELAEARRQLESLSAYRDLLDEEGSATRQLTEAIEEATRLRATAQSLLAAAKAAAAREPERAKQRAKELTTQADALLDRATREAGRLIEEAQKKAEEIGGDAYRALREKDQLDLAVKAIRNVVDGYGDRYIVPTRSMLDDLGADYGHTEAGQRLVEARDQTKRLVEEGQAAACDYAEQNRRDTAIRFVIDAFNGRVDALLSRVKHDNHGTLAQEITDAFALVNLNGEAFRNARIVQAYLDARLQELKWAVVTQELRLREREEQLRIKEQMREEERARREYERAIEDAKKEELAIQKALKQARAEAADASASERAKLERRIAELAGQLEEAEAKNQRAISMAQQTRKGTIYIISNIGSFGEDVFKIGMTRRLEPSERIKELGDASVPFEFDVHAMITTDDAPALEGTLHKQFHDHRINQVNHRKEFFRVPLEQLRKTVVAAGLEVSFTMLAEAREYRETQALSKMTPKERAKYEEASRTHS